MIYYTEHQNMQTRKWGPGHSTLIGHSLVQDDLEGGGAFDKVVEIFDAFDDVQNPWPFFTFLHDNGLDNF